MSSSVTPDVISSLLTAEYSTLAAFSLITYDWLVRFDDEIRCFWTFGEGRKPTAAAFIYALSRYPIILQLALSVQTINPMSDTECRINSYAQVVTSTLQLFTPAIFSALRVYALSGGRKILAGSTFLLLCAPGVGLNLVTNVVFFHIMNLPKPFNCSLEDETPEGIRHSFILVSRICAIVGDVSVLVVTWWNTYPLYKMQQGLVTRQSVVRVMLYDGSLYFLAITALNVFHMVFTLWESSGNGVYSTDAGYIDYFLSPITNILIAHFLLNLRQADHAAAHPSGSTPSAMHSLRCDALHQTTSLPAFVASMGEPIHTRPLNPIEEIIQAERMHEGRRGSSTEEGCHGEDFGDGMHPRW